MAPVSTSVPAAVVLKAVRGWRLFPCRTEIDWAVTAAHPLPDGQHRLPLADAGRGDGRTGGRQLAAITGTRRCGLGLPAADGHARARRTGRIGPCCAGLHRRHVAPVGHGTQQPGHRDRRVGDGDQRTAACPAGARRCPAPAAGPARAAATGALGAVRGRRPEQSGSGAANARFPRRGRARAADDLRVQRPVGLHHARRRGKGRVGHVHRTARTAFPARHQGSPGRDPVQGTARRRPGPRPPGPVSARRADLASAAPPSP